MTPPRFFGVVHSAIVLRDQSIARMDEEAFRAALSAKVDVSVNIDRVFGGSCEDLLVRLVERRRLTARERAVLEAVLREGRP